MASLSLTNLRFPTGLESTTMLCFIVTYYILLGVYRLYFSPLAKFPGPKLAAVTSWYEFYYDIVLGGKFPFRMRELHAQYGPVVRINPHELAVSDPNFYSVLYANAGKRRDKWKPVPGQKWVRDSVAGSMSHEQHRMRRSAINPTFSTARVFGRHDIYNEKIEKFMGRIDGFATTQEVVLGWKVLAALTNDSIMKYCLGYDYDRLATPSFQNFKEHDEILQNLVGGHRIKQFGSIPRYLESIVFQMPHAWLTKIMPPFRKILEEQRSIADSVRAVGKSSQESISEHPPTIFEDLLRSKLPDSEKAPERIAQESMTVVIAGTHGTAFAIATGIYYLLASPSTLQRLKTELKEAIPDPTQSPSWKEMEKLPFLRGVVQEALRLSYGSSARLPRVSPVDVLSVRDEARSRTWDIPPGIPIGMSSFQTHHDETVFPNSDNFEPERWSGGSDLDRYMVSFTKGSRGCLGINLAYALMFLTFARLFRAYGSEGYREEGDKGYLQLFETTFDDIKIVKDGFLPLSRNGSHGLQFVVRK